MNPSIIRNDDRLLESQLTDRLANGLVGLLLIRLGVPPNDDFGERIAVVDKAVEATIDRLIERLEPDDIIAVTSSGLVAVARSNLSAPAETEGLALRLHGELGRPMILDDAVIHCRVSIGTAMSAAVDSAVDLFRYARHALDDARALGGDRIGNFDDADRNLLLPANKTDESESW